MIYKRNVPILVLTIALGMISSCTRTLPDNTETDDMKTNPEATDNFVLVQGGTFVNTKSNLYGKRASITDFYIGKYEVTQKEWTEVMGSNPSQFEGDNLPVEMVSWYDCIEYCNKRSLQEGLKPYYTIDKHTKDHRNKADIDTVKWTVTIQAGANGYRLPTEAEWEYAAGGGQVSKSYSYSGSNDLNEAGWYWRNSGDSILRGGWLWPTIKNNHCQAKPVGSKKPNELGLHDMTGNVREWCEDWYEDFEMASGLARVQRGCGWMSAEDFCVITYRGSFEANGIGPDQGFRLCRSK
jgi:formylglycine-generating enzyme required for sulfatase activity